jgi:hypothetical protein
MLEDDVIRILRELRTLLRARVVEITRSPEARTGVVGHLRPLGGDEYLRVELGDHTPADVSVPEQLERTARQLRTVARLADATLPEVTAADVAATPPQHALLHRIVVFLEALANQSHAENAILLLRGNVVASARPVEELWHLRLDFIAKQVAAHATHLSSHGEYAGADVFALGFWYDAMLVVPQQPGYGEDFVRHRCRLVARELAHLLPELLPDPPALAAQRPQ